MEWPSQPTDRFGAEGGWEFESDGRAASGSELGRAGVRPKRWSLHPGHGGHGSAGGSPFGPHLAPGSGPTDR